MKTKILDYSALDIPAGYTDTETVLIKDDAAYMAGPASGPIPATALTMTGPALLGRTEASNGPIEELSSTSAKSLLAIAYTDVSGLSTVAHTGQYSDLLGVPSTIISGTLTPGYLPFANSPTSIADSIASQSGTTITITGNETLTGTLNLSGLTASTILGLDGSKNVVSRTVTGSLGFVMLSVSPTTTGTLTGAISNWSGLLSANAGLTVAGNLTTALTAGRVALVGTAGLLTQDEIYWNATGLGVGASPDWQLDVKKSNAGGAVVGRIKNTSSAANSIAYSLIETSGAALNAFQTFLNTSQTWSHGLAADDSSAYKISNGATLGTNNWLSISTAGLTTLAGDLTLSGSAKNISFSHASAHSISTVNGSLTVRANATSGALILDAKDNGEPGASNILLQNDGVTKATIDGLGVLVAGIGNSKIVGTDSSGYLVAASTTGSLGSVVLSVSPTITGTLTGAISNWSGALTVSGDGTANDVSVISASSSVYSSYKIRRSRGTPGSPSNIATGDYYGGIRFQGYSGATGWWDTASILSNCDTSVTNNQRPASTLEFYTNASTGAVTLALTISHAQRLTFEKPPIINGLTGTSAVFTDGTNLLVSNAITGGGNVVMSASPTLTGTLTAGAINASGHININSAVDTTDYYLNVKSGSIALDGGYSFVAFGVGSPTNVAAGNTEFVSLTHNGAGHAGILVGKTGLGTYRDFLISTSLTERFRVKSTGEINLTGLTASTALGLDASKNIVSVTYTGSGNAVLSASPTLTGTITAAAITMSSTLTVASTFVFNSGSSVSPEIQMGANAVSNAANISASESSGGGVLVFKTKTTGGTSTEAFRIGNDQITTFSKEVKLSSSNTVNSSVLATVTNKIKVNVGGTDYYLLANTSNA